MTSPLNEGDSLDQLQTPEQVELLDTIDKLRNQGLGHYNISLPQLIVCGDQSSGKSSVLEGLTRLRFPTKEGICTTFATELVLRKNTIPSILCTIIPGKERSQAEKDELSKFKQTFTSPEEFAFPKLLEEARKCMAFGVQPDHGNFFEDILQIRYSGPDLPSLTIVDLPGIVQSHRQGSRAVQTVRDLVQGYMADQRSIILAIVHAKCDYETQANLLWAKAFDPTAARTMGIITKPDCLDPNSDSEAQFIKLAKNQEYPLDLGWHCVKNRGFGMDEQSNKERDESEAQFFAAGNWAPLSRANVGIDALRNKLSRVLLQHIRKELPSLSVAIFDALAATERSLKGLGQPRDEAQQQRNFLMEKAQRFQALTLDALRGIYSDPFFALSLSDSIPPARLRTEIQNLNLAFAYTMYRKGHQWQIVDGQYSPGHGFPSLLSTSIDNYDGLPEPINIERSKFLNERIGTQVRLSRPSGLPSLVNTWVIGEVFRQQAQPWEAIARQHLSDVYDAVNAYLHESLSNMMDQDTFHALMQEHVEPELQQRWQRLSAKLDELLVPYQQQEPIIYDPSFIHDLEQIRAKRYFEPKNQFALGSAPKSAPTQLLTESMDDFTNCEILNLMHTYYKKSISVFISNVTVLAIENCLITELPSLLNPELVLNMEEEKLSVIAAESEEISSERAALKQKLEDLKAGKRVLDSQARRSGKVTRNTPRSQKAPPKPAAAQAQPPRPKTPVSQTTPQNSDVQIDDLTSGINAFNLTPPAKPKHQIATLTPPKSPKAAAEPTPTWKMRERVDSWRSEDWEE
ncbi:hypothetical protein K458DRAFT_391003 [Lentithecium fluviatile CBS 122367]|uniref:P-loop containing nucleoside triphosphate hydrolase protein n=1 Tax=Lentithecium fluviatile CBS 122367 TaxID=1168545 RepID=A0A6G1IWM4_9PLEO|nr:hypothetical protein K458DRAFT_391003 [Lentithecium fluviatile CBS 122367]